ncbi:glycosyltransferase [Brevibacillus ginsengisoli]|uniref:glycosyltransferase n=1 Tax=Brevibacillus ginsengisoli TaxID=363854 RepID=UPI003CF6C2E0
MDFMGILGIIFLGIWLGLIGRGLPGLLRMTQLRRTSKVELPASYHKWPKVSIIVTACNEERSIDEAIRSLLAIDYPDYEIIAINDRSTDGTGRILDEIHHRNPKVQVLHIEKLPEGWLGKNHALYQGTKQAHGDWLLFTDADVVFDPRVLSIAMSHVLYQGYDHLALAPKMVSSRFWLRGLIFLFMFNLMLFFCPQNAKNPRSNAYMGVGAFNLIRSDVYQAIGTHQVIRMRPDDDLKLGERVKRLGYKQDFGLAEEILRVEWYPSILDMMRGLEKNTMAPFEYRASLLLLGLIPLSLLYLLPFIGLFVTSGWNRAVYLLMFFCCLLYFSLHDRFSFRSVVYYLLFPILVPLFIYTLGRAAILMWKRGGIIWRGTLYPLETLKMTKPRL